METDANITIQDVHYDLKLQASISKNDRNMTMKNMVHWHKGYKQLKTTKASVEQAEMEKLSKIESNI